MFEDHQSIFVVKSRKGYEKRRALLSAAFDHLTKDSLQTLTVVQVCSSVGLKRNSFYTHFSGIEELLDALSGDLLSKLIEKLNRSSPIELRENGSPRHHIQSVIDTARSDPRTAIVLHRLYADHLPTQQAIQGVVHKGLRAWIDAEKVQIPARAIPSLARMLITIFMDVLRQIGDCNGDQVDIDLIFDLFAKVGDLAKCAPPIQAMNQEPLVKTTLSD